MKKWAVIDKVENEEWVKSYGAKEKAIEEARLLFNHLTESEKRKREIIVGLVNLDDEDNYIDGDVCEIVLKLPN